MVVFAFAEEPGFVEGDFFGGGVFCLVEGGEEDGVFAEFLVDLVDGGGEGGAVGGGLVFEEGRGVGVGGLEPGESDGDFDGL